MSCTPFNHSTVNVPKRYKYSPSSSVRKVQYFGKPSWQTYRCKDTSKLQLQVLVQMKRIMEQPQLTSHNNSNSSSTVGPATTTIVHLQHPSRRARVLECTGTANQTDTPRTISLLDTTTPVLLHLAQEGTWAGCGFYYCNNTRHDQCFCANFISPQTR